MTRKKAKPQHRETDTNEPNEGGFYKMLWNSMENDLGDRATASPEGNSPVVMSDQDSPQHTCDTSHSFSTSASILAGESNPGSHSNDVNLLANVDRLHEKDEIISREFRLLKNGDPVQRTSQVESINNSLCLDPPPSSDVERAEENHQEDPEEPQTSPTTLSNQENDEVCDLIETCGNRCMVESVQPPAPNTTMPNSTGKALSLLKSLLNQSDDDLDSHNFELNTSLDQTSKNDLSTTFPLSSRQIPEKPSHEPPPEIMDVELGVTPQKKEDIDFPLAKNFLPSKIKIEPFLVLKSLKSLRDDIKSLYDDLIEKNLVAVQEKIEAERPASPDVEILQSPSLRKSKCCVKVERLPDPFVSSKSVSTTDKTWKAWKCQIIRQRNEEKFRHLKVWRRGRTLLWRECELAGMDRVTYDEQVAFIKKHKLSESSSERENSSSSDSENGRGFSDSEDDALHMRQMRSGPLPPSPRMKKPLGKGLKYRSAAATALAKSRLGNEYFVEPTTHNELEGKKPLKITIRKTSLNKSEDEHEKEPNFMAPSKPLARGRKYYAAKTTYRKPEEHESKQRNLSKKSFYLEDNVDNQALLGRRSDEVENFNLLEKWDIPFEAPTLFRSPRVASRLAQLKTKENLTPKQYKKSQKQPVSKEVKDVVETLCTKTVESMLFPQEVIVVDSNPSVAKLDAKCVEQSLAETISEPPVQKLEMSPSNDANQSSKSVEICNESKDVEYFSSTDTLSELSSKENVPLPKKARRIRRKSSIFGSPKKRRKFVNVSQVPKGVAVVPAQTTQVPVVSEGPGQSPLQSEEDSVAKKNSEPLRVEEVKIGNNSTENVDSIVSPRVTRSKQPSIEVDLDLIESLEGKRKKKKEGESAIDTVVMAGKPGVKKNQRKSRTLAQAKKNPPDLDNSNTQVDEVSEGPGEQIESEEQLKVEESTPRVLRGRVINETANAKNQEKSDELEKIGAEIGSVVPPTILDSPMSPVPDAVEFEKPSRVTRSRKRLTRETVSSIASKSNLMEKKTELETESKVPHLSVTQIDFETSQPADDVSETATSAAELTKEAEESFKNDSSADIKVQEPEDVNQVISTPGINLKEPEVSVSETTGALDSKHEDGAEKDKDEASAVEVEIEKATLSKIEDSPNVLSTDLEHLPDDDTKDKSGSDLNSSSDRLAVLDALNTIRSSIDSEKKDEAPPLPTPSLPGCIDLPLESLILPDELDDDDFGDFGDLVVDEEFSEDENDDNPLAVRIKKIVQDQLLKNHEDELKEGKKNSLTVKEALLKAVDKAVNRVADVFKEDCVDKVNDATEKCEGKIATSQENQDSKTALIGKKRESIDEKTGLPTSLIQRLRDPRIRSKLLSQLEESENVLTEKKIEKAPVEDNVPSNEDPMKEARPRIALNDPRCQQPAAPKPVVPQDPNPEPPVAEPSVVENSQPLLSAPPAPKAHEDSDEEESIKRRPKKIKKQVDMELMYKSPLEDLNAESRPSYVRERGPVRRGTYKIDRRWERPPPMRRTTLSERPVHQNHVQEHWSTPQEMAASTFDPWRHPWSPGLKVPYQKPDSHAAYMETVLVNLALLPKTTSLNVPPLKKIYHHFNMGNPQILPIPPPSFDPKEEMRTITMCDPMGHEMIDVIQLPRPTSGLTSAYFDDLPPGYSIDDIITKPYMSLADVVDEEAESVIYGGSFTMSDDEDGDDGTNIIEDLGDDAQGWPSGVAASDDSDVLVSEPVKAGLSKDPLENILQNLPLLKEQYSVDLTPPPPPTWTVDLLSPSSPSADSDSGSSPRKRRRSPSPSPRRRRRSSSSRSRSRSPRRRRSRSRSLERRHRRSESVSPPYIRWSSSSISPSRKRHSKR